MSDDAIKAIAKIYLNQKDNNYHPWELNKGQLSFLAEHWTETKECIEEYLTNSRSVNVITHLKVLRKKKNLLLEQADADRIYSALFAQHRYFELSYFSEDAGVPPSAPVLKDLWEGFFRQAWRAHDLESLVGRFGKPALAKKEVDRLCNDWLAEFAGEKETKRRELIQPEEFSKIVELTGEQPTWDTALAQRVYARWIKKGHIHKSLFSYLRTVVGAQPRPEDVQGYYRAVLTGKQGHGETPVASALEEGIALTGVIPDTQAVEQYYQTKLSQKTLKEARKVEKLTGVPIPAEHINYAYNRLLNSGEFHELRTLQRDTGIAARFEPSTIQEAYAAFFTRDNLQSAIQLYLETDIEPQGQDANVIQKCCTARLKNDKEYHSAWQEVKWLAATLPSAATPVIQEHIRELVAEEKFRTVEDLLRTLDGEVQPAVQEQFAIACQKADWTTAQKILSAHTQEVVEQYSLYAKAAHSLTNRDLIGQSRSFVEVSDESSHMP
jgi:hypothetical protein